MAIHNPISRPRQHNPDSKSLPHTLLSSGQGHEGPAMTRPLHSTTDLTTAFINHSAGVAIKSPQPQRPLRWLSQPVTAGDVSFCNNERNKNQISLRESNDTCQNGPHVKRVSDHSNISRTGIAVQTELLNRSSSQSSFETVTGNNDTHNYNHDTESSPQLERFTSAEDLMKQSMALRNDFESRHSSKLTQMASSQPQSSTSSSSSTSKPHAKKPSLSAPFQPFSQTELPTPNDTPTEKPRQPRTPFVTPRRSAASSYVDAGSEDMTAAQSPESSDDEDEGGEAELELSVGRLGLGRHPNGGNSPANGLVEAEQSVKSALKKEQGNVTGSVKTGYELSVEDRAVLERAAAIVRGQVRNFEQEINANIHQQVKDLYRDSLDPPDIADMDSLPDFHLRGNPSAPSAIVKSVQVCCAVERGLAAILEVQRSVDREENGGEKREESLMEVCVRRPQVVGREMGGAVAGIAKTVGYGGREKRGDSVEWKV